MTVVLVEIVKTNNINGFAFSFTFLASNLKPPTSNTLPPAPSTQQRKNQ